jgi:hypothetical protein
MPRDYLPASNREREASSLPPAQPDTKSEGIELFGPVDVDQKEPESKKIEKPNSKQ